MRKIAAITFQSLDGVMQAPSHPAEDTTGNFKSGGWAAPFWQEVMEDVRREAMNQEYDLLLGRKTYDLFAPHWRDADLESLESQRLNNGIKYLVSREQPGVKWEKTVCLMGDILRQINQLKSNNGPLIQIHGSWQLIQLLNSQNLIDEYRIWTFPVVLGAGKRLFESSNGFQRFKVKSNKLLANGVHRMFLAQNP